MSGRLLHGQLGIDSQIHVTEDGLLVTDDGEVVRVRIGKLANGDYGITITDGSGNVLIDGDSITITGSTGTISANQLSGGTVASGIALGISQTTVTADGVEVSHSGVDRVTLGALGGGDYGLKITNPAGTVILDGTSNMFKIAATGTFSAPSNGSVAGTYTSAVTLSTGFTYIPAVLAFLETTGGGQIVALPLVTLVPTGEFAGHVIDHFEMRVEVVSTNQTKLTCRLITTRNSPVGGNTIRYYVLKEAGL